MKAILEFNSPEDDKSLYDAINGSAFKYCLQEMDEQLRGWIKYGHNHKDADEAIQSMRNHLHQLIQDNDLILE